MSTIHKALQKAQKSKDHRLEKYGPISSTPPQKPGLLRGRRIGWISLLLITSALALLLYSWFDSEKPKASFTAEKTRKTVPPPPSPRENVFDSTAFYEKARTHHREGRMQDAKRLYQRILEADPGHVGALNNLGVIYLKEKNYPEARKRFEKAFRLNPDNVNPCYNLACLYAIRGDTLQSILYLKKAVSINPAVKEWARTDSDLSNLRGLPAFEEIIRS